ncbi:MAG: cupredoxin family copper-binding protein [Povalibacter sp.]
MLEFTRSYLRHSLPQIAAIALGLAAYAAWSADQSAAAPATGTTIVIENMGFTPAEVVVKRGTRVTWTNKDMFPHTATANGKTFDSGNIEANASWSYVASEPGDYAYVCALHPTMKGRLIVR